MKKNSIFLLSIFFMQQIAFGQSFTSEIDYQIQRQFKGPLQTFEVFSTVDSLSSYVAGGANTRAYAGQIIILALPNETPVPLIVKFDGTNYSARSIAPANADPNTFSIADSKLELFWSDPGATSTNEGVIATSTISTNGIAAVEFDATGPLDVVIQKSDTNLVEWTEYESFTTPGAIRVVFTNIIPFAGDATTTVTNIQAFAWSRIDLVGAEIDTTGQIIEVDTATRPKQAMPLAQVEGLIAEVNSSDWSSFPATGTVFMNGNRLVLGQGWSISNTNGLGVVSHTDFAVSTNGLTLAHNGIPGLSLTSGAMGLKINTFAITNNAIKVGIDTNGVTSKPILQWADNLSSIDRQVLAPWSETYPATNSAGDYGIIAVPPSLSNGFVWAVQQTGEAAITLHANTIIEGSIAAFDELIADWASISNIPAAITNYAMNMDQGVATSDTPEFAGLTVGGEAVLTGYVQTNDTRHVQLNTLSVTNTTHAGDGAGALIVDGGIYAGGGGYFVEDSEEAGTGALAAKSANGLSEALLANENSGAFFYNYSGSGSSANLANDSGDALYGEGNIRIGGTSGDYYHNYKQGVTEGDYISGGLVVKTNSLVSTEDLSGYVETNHTGDVSITGSLTAGSYAAEIEPYLIAISTNITISAANGMQQAITGDVPASVTINFPTGSATSEMTISLTLPPVGTNAITLAAGPTYYYVSPLSSSVPASTNLYTRYYVASPYGSTNASVTAMGEVQ